VGPKRTGKSKTTKEKVIAPNNMKKKKKKWLFWTASGDLRKDEEKFRNYFILSMDYFEDLYETIKYSLQIGGEYSYKEIFIMLGEING
jgi:hypothetical protein